MAKVFRYDRHARRRMRWRKISELEVETVLSEPDMLEMTEKGRTNAFKQVGRRYLKVTYKEFSEEETSLSAL